MFNTMRLSLSALVVMSGVLLGGTSNEAQAQFPQLGNQIRNQFVGGPGQQPGQQPGQNVAPAYVPPGQPPFNNYSLGVYTQVVPVPAFGNPGGGPAFAYVNPNPGQGGSPSQYGLMITGLTPGGAAQRAGLEVGDIIVSANGQPTPNVEMLRYVLNSSNGYVNLNVRNVRPPHAYVQVPAYLGGGGFPIGQPAAASPY